MSCCPKFLWGGTKSIMKKCSVPETFICPYGVKHPASSGLFPQSRSHEQRQQQNVELKLVQSVQSPKAQEVIKGHGASPVGRKLGRLSGSKK